MKKLRLRKRKQKQYDIVVNPWEHVRRRIDVSDAVSSLPGHLCQAITLHYIARYQAHQIATLMNVSHKTVSRYLAEGREALVSHLFTYSEP